MKAKKKTPTRKTVEEKLRKLGIDGWPPITELAADEAMSILGEVEEILQRRRKGKAKYTAKVVKRLKLALNKGMAEEITNSIRR